MGRNSDGEIEGETTRVAAVRYLQGALGHATGSLCFLLAGGLVWMGGYRGPGGVLIVGAVLLSANGISIWAWGELVARFSARSGDDEEPTRTLRAQPLSTKSLAEMKAGVLMTGVFLAVLLAGRAGLAVFGPQAVAALFVGCTVVGDVLALVWSVTRDR